MANEQVLRFYKKKSTYYRNLTDNPGKVQHYGGNEHVYRNYEYQILLTNAGFWPIKRTIPVYYYNPKAMLNYCLNYRGAEIFEYSYSNVVLRAIWYLLLKVLLKNHFAATIAGKVSLISNTFIGVKSSV